MAIVRNGIARSTIGTHLINEKLLVIEFEGLFVDAAYS
jgi:hypothetical protein